MKWQKHKTMLVNTELLLERIKTALENYLNKIRMDNNAFLIFQKCLERDFKDDVNVAKELMK